jgi:hypothetical protein
LYFDISNQMVEQIQEHSVHDFKQRPFNSNADSFYRRTQTWRKNGI